VASARGSSLHGLGRERASGRACLSRSAMVAGWALRRRLARVHKVYLRPCVASGGCGPHTIGAGYARRSPSCGSHCTRVQPRHGLSPVLLSSSGSMSGTIVGGDSCVLAATFVRALWSKWRATRLLEQANRRAVVLVAGLSSPVGSASRAGSPHSVCIAHDFTASAAAAGAVRVRSTCARAIHVATCVLRALRQASAGGWQSGHRWH